LNNSTRVDMTGSVLSADGTTIGYRHIGSGPGIVLLHGGMRASQHYLRLAAQLSDAFTVYVPDRRGRGRSLPHGDQYSITKECEDVDALLTKTGTHFVFGHSSGGLIALQAALTLPSVQKVAVYEPPLSLHGSAPTSWEPRYEREIVRGKLASALITLIKGLKLNRGFTLLPRWLLLPFIKRFLQKAKQTLKPPEVSMETLIPTQRFDQRLVKEMDGSIESFALLRTEVFLLGGDKSPAFLRDALDALEKVLPHTQRIEFKGLDHGGPGETAPERIGKELRGFFSTSS
jgi:pimeloyl-ACP methyl ester carboxylesterase